MHWHRNPWRVRHVRPWHMRHVRPWHMRRMQPYRTRRWFWGRPWGWHPYRRHYWGCACLPFLLVPLMIIGATAFFGFLSWFMW